VSASRCAGMLLASLCRRAGVQVCWHAGCEPVPACRRVPVPACRRAPVPGPGVPAPGRAGVRGPGQGPVGRGWPTGLRNPTSRTTAMGAGARATGTGQRADAFLVSFTSYSWFRYQKKSGCGHAETAIAPRRSPTHRSSGAVTTRVAHGRAATEAKRRGRIGPWPGVWLYAHGGHHANRDRKGLRTMPPIVSHGKRLQVSEGMSNG
jgi:hypothetical protein